MHRADSMKFSTEVFVDAVIADVHARHKLNPQRIAILAWSSSGPAAYAISLTSPKIKRSLIAMSVFRRDWLPPLKQAKGHRYYLYHSPDDRVCPFRMAEQAAKVLQEQQAEVKLVTYAGGHGWRGRLYDDIRGGLEWLERPAASSDPSTD
jgi:predicted esterase